MDTPCLSDLSEARGNIYAFLSSLLLKPPTPELLAPLSRAETLDSLAVIFGEGPLAPLREMMPHLSEKLDMIVQDYNDLFIVPLGAYVTPYEAVYRDEREIKGKCIKGLLADASTVSVLKSYQEAGIALNKDFLDLPDHAGIELAFMAFVCRKQVESMREGETEKGRKYLEMQKSFLKEHLNPWIPALCRRIKQNASSSFFKCIARLIESFLSLEAENLISTAEE